MLTGISRSCSTKYKRRITAIYCTRKQDAKLIFYMKEKKKSSTKYPPYVVKHIGKKYHENRADEVSLK